MWARQLHTYDDPSLALVKSVAVQAAANNLDHPLVQGVDQYCQAMIKGDDLPAPKPGALDESDPGITAYLAFLHHHKAHAIIGKNPDLEEEIQSQLDAFTFGHSGWQKMFDQYVRYYWNYPHHHGAKPHYRSWKDPEFGNNDPNYGVIDWKIPSEATIALIGDIGTGTDVAASVLLSALSFKPDVILHVGDVYYSGTEFEFQNYFAGLIESVYRDQGVSIPVFTLPGNHEYFTGAIPYFGYLDSRKFYQSDQQKQVASYFSLETEDGGWQFLGMDTSYHGHYMGVKSAKLAAALKDLHVDPSTASDPVTPPDMVYLRPDEEEWHHHQLDHFCGRTILLGHHQLYSANQKVGIDPQPGVDTRLWQSFSAYFDRKVAAWFWGHEHNLCIYEDSFKPFDSSPLLKGRCVGHSAIPVAEHEAPYKANNPVPLIESTELSLTDGWFNRGFQILKVHGAGKPVDTTYYQTAGTDPSPLKIYQETIR